ncbi:MAG: hypothetical protein CMO06_01265 [Thalassospira sp.]|uniref:hypothetical protein n=1 Tax=Thalassospira sp. TaxID=1912094 RepID=UPI000C4E7C42|nr:hypothetical protein [Thalassospira sp.]MAZ31768.1 hypothetical protein [Thalassospira sp.]
MPAKKILRRPDGKFAPANGNVTRCGAVPMTDPLAEPDRPMTFHQVMQQGDLKTENRPEMKTGSL